VSLLRWVGRAIGLSVHHDFCVVAICENGVVRSAGQVASIPEGISALDESLLSSDRVALEVAGSCWKVARMCLGMRGDGRGHAARGCQLAGEPGVAFWSAHVLVERPNLNAHSSAARSTYRASRSYTGAASSHQTSALRRVLAEHVNGHRPHVLAAPAFTRPSGAPACRRCVHRSGRSPRRRRCRE
jgi:hypothetical protein